MGEIAIIRWTFEALVWNRFCGSLASSDVVTGENLLAPLCSRSARHFVSDPITTMPKFPTVFVRKVSRFRWTFEVFTLVWLLRLNWGFGCIVVHWFLRLNWGFGGIIVHWLLR